MIKLFAYIMPLILLLLGLQCRKSKPVTFLILLYFWVIMGLNTYTPDYESYKLIYFYSTNVYSNVNVESGFRAICVLFNNLGASYQQFRMIWAAIYAILAFFTARRLSSHVNYVLAMFLLWPFIPFVSGLRMAMAVMIVCFSIPFLLEDGKRGIVKYVIGIVIAAQIQMSTLFYLILIFTRKKYTVRQYLQIFFAVVFGSVLIRSSILDVLIDKYFSGTVAHKLTKWISMSDETDVAHLNIVGFTANVFFVVAFALLINTISKLIISKYKQELVLNDDYATYENKIKRITVYKNISFCIMLTIPGYIVSSEYQRLLYGVLIVYYAVFAEFKYNRLNMGLGNKQVYKVICFGLIILTAAFYIYSTQSHDVFATLVDNILFQ